MFKLSGSAKDLTGQHFGKLLVIEPIGRTSNGRSNIIWLCVCTCGESKEVLSQHLLSGGTRSCGCLVSKRIRPGQSKHPLYITWKNMIARCHSPTAAGYHRYGGRGIHVCNRWKNNFDTFVKDIGPRPNKLTLDRINNNKGYYPLNCRWASRKLQRANR